MRPACRECWRANCGPIRCRWCGVAYPERRILELDAWDQRCLDAYDSAIATTGRQPSRRWLAETWPIDP